MSSAGSRFTTPYAYAQSSTGAPIPGAFLYFYVSGTSTPQNTYSDAGLTTPNPNPVPANAYGVFPNIFLGTQPYKVVLTDANLNQIWTADPVSGIGVSSQSQQFTFLTTAILLAAFGSGVVLAAGTLAQTTGRTTAVDGGGGLFWYNAADVTSADNGGTIRVDAQNRRWYAVASAMGASAQLFGADITGVADSAPAFTSWIAGIEDGDGYIGPGSYTLNTQVTWTAGDGAVFTDIGADFSGAGGNLNLAYLALGSSTATPTIGLDISRKTFDATWVVPGSDNFNVMNFARCGVSDGTLGQLVVIQGTALANFAGTSMAPISSFAGEFSVFANAGYTNCTALEAIVINNADNTVLGNGFVVSSLGTGGALTNAIVVQSRQAAIWTDGVHFNNSTQTAVSGDVISFLGSAGSVGATNGIHFSGLFTTAEINTPSLRVGPSTVQTGVYGNRIFMVGSAAAGVASIIPSAGNLALGAIAPLATNATEGFPAMPTSAGAPTGIPAGVVAGMAPFEYDSSTHKFWVFDAIAGAWKGVAVA
jgi:hypothetical protein